MMSTATCSPLVSDIIPVYNGELYLAEAIGSVFSQTYRHVEVVVVDDGSTDRSSHIARSFGEVRCIYQQNLGVAAARNTGVSAAKADLLTFLDADDLWPPGRLRAQVAHFLEHPHIGFAFGRCRAFLEPGVPKPGWLDPDALEGKQIGYFPGTLLATRSALQTVGTFNPSYRVGEGAEWYVRAQESGVPMAVIDEVLLLRRIHRCNLTHQGEGINSSILQALKESLDRKRRSRPNPLTER